MYIPLASRFETELLLYIRFLDFVCLSQQTPIIFVNNNGAMITSTESNILFLFLREWMVLFNDVIYCKVDVAAVVH